MMKIETRQVYQERILRVLIHIQRHLDEPLELNELAAMAYFSPFHFHRIFRGLVGESVMEHIRRLRLERAVLRLRDTGRSILDIALEAGYETHESFTRAFRSQFGLAPSSAREGISLKKTDGLLSGVHYQPRGEIPKFQPLTQGGAAMEMKIVRREPTRVAFVRHIGPYEDCGEAWGKLCAWAGRRGLLGPQTTVIGISYDDPEITPPEKIRYDACVTVAESVGPEGEIGVQTLRGGDYAMTLHRGPYEKLAETFGRIFGQWAPQSGRVVSSDPCLEVYLNDPHRTPPEELKTEIYVPLEK
jgi:AraC family transcriptional regulator